MKINSYPQGRMHLLLALAAAILFLTGHTALGNNPPITNLLTNLSMSTQVSASEDCVPEMVVDGNTIHALWTTWVDNNQGYLFYRRSADKGETWEPPIQIWQYKSGGSTTTVYSRRMAVSGNMVYIAICDYDYYNNGTGFLYLAKSSNGGASFGAPVEIDNSGGGFSGLSSSYIRATGNKVAIVYRDANYNDAFEGLYCQYSGDQGNTFVRTPITTENTSSISDFLFEGDQMIVLHSYAYFYYGLSVGRIYVSISNNNGSSFTMHKLSPTYTDQYGEKERCLSLHDARYAPKLAKDGTGIHVIFTGNNQSGVYTILYARSGNNGQSFSEAVDINKGFIGNIQSGQECVVASNGHVYMSYLSTSSKAYLVRSSNGGATLSEPGDLLTATTHYIQTSWWPQMAIDPSDETGRTVYFGAGAMMTRKSDDAGESFSGTMMLAPFMTNIDVRGSALVIDEAGQVHWLSKARWSGAYDFDVFHGSKKPQPDPGTENKAFSFETRRYEKYELAIVPSSPTIAFDSVMTGEAWIRIRAGSDNPQNIFSKVNGYDGANYQCPGYHMTFDNNYGKRRFLTGLQTDKGEFMNWTGTDLKDTLWHHVAFTYDAGGELNNFRSYLDGLLIAQQTVTGQIIPGDGMLLIGSRTFLLHESTSYLFDDIRLWNRALSQEELLENQTKAFTGAEEGLVMWLSFDDTFKDMSGNGNDAIPLYLGEMVPSGIDPPATAFEVFKVSNEASFNNKTTNATSYAWAFGNGQTSVLANPKYAYPTPGEYMASLTGSNSTTVKSAVQLVSIEGLERVEPLQSGNRGFVTLTVYGGGLTVSGSTLLLRKRDGSTEITGRDLHSPAPGQLSAQFLLDNAELGMWDVVVRRNASEQALVEVFKIVQATLPEPWVSLSGRGATLFNMWQSYTISYGNRGNVDALGVPLNLVISDIDGLDFEMIDFKIEPNDYMKQHFPEITAIMDTLYIEVADYFGPGHNARFYPMMIPLIEANSTHTVRIRMKSPASYQIECWVLDPWYYTDEAGKVQAMAPADDWPDEKTKLNACIALSGMAAAQSVAADLIGTVLPIDCINDVGMWLYNPWDKAKPEHNRSSIFSSSTYSLASAVLSCASDLTPYRAVKIAGKILSAINNMYAGYKAHMDCLRAFDPRYKNKMNVNAVGSFDPNEMVGPSGYGPEGYIPLYHMMPYTVLFENKPDATAPAHIVTVTDTLDLARFDLKSFGFGAFGWGDTVFSAPGGLLKEFSRDIDMRPDLPLITRVSAKLDTLSGVVRWEFLSLNPEAMELEEDPFIGFLPPNATSPEGEGFVSFMVGLKPGLGTNDAIRNKASIVFDANAPIITNEYLNTLDLDAPQSYVNPLQETTPNHFQLSWTGNDTGSGIGQYTIYVLENDTLMYAWLTTTESSALFSGQVGSSYQFFSIATDNVSLIEETPEAFDAYTTLTVDVDDIKLVKGAFRLYPNPGSGNLVVELDNMAGNEAVHIEVYDILGARVFRNDFEAAQQYRLNLEALQAGVYMVRVMKGDTWGVARWVKK